MLHFLRRIRRGLINTGNTSKYLLYAIGEIALVVIGILIALSINNWNDQKIATEKEHNALVEVKSDLELNVSSLNTMLFDAASGVENYLNSLDIIITNLEETKIYHDSLAFHFSIIFSYPDLMIKTSGYESLTSIGMDLISDHHLRSEIGTFYTYRIPRTRIAYHEQRDDFYHYMLDYLNKEFITTRGENGISTSRVPVDYEAMTTNREFIESLKSYSGVFVNFKTQSLLALTECEALHTEIENELKEL